MKRKLGPPRWSRCKEVGYRKTSCKANLGDGDSGDATEEARSSHVPIDGDSSVVGDGANDASALATKETRPSHVPSDGDSTATGDGANDASAAAHEGHFDSIPPQSKPQPAQPSQTGHHTTHGRATNAREKESSRTVYNPKVEGR
ncbi:hypothetical protein CRG98_007657 [Punica granatum]|uniref:Uncharacterized protein n=1 Tax=Punica granatum TaxID=22663 RepID=A0A2I0KU29_PUNGR|nr:hypothetical protein CRG98_007657 [Punica granatum]